MIKHNYDIASKLLDIEEFDFDTRDLNETGINVDRAFLPRRYDIEKALNDFDFSDDFDWQITYKFPNKLRNNMFNGHVYGGANVTMRRLYLILCERFNGGKYFIEDYFDTIYEYTLKDVIDKKLERLKQELLAYLSSEFEGAVVTKKGTLHKIRKINKVYFEKMDELESFVREYEDVEGEEIARLIKEDIIDCVSTGRIPLDPSFNTKGTEEARTRAGLPDIPRFYASSQLINSIQIFVKIGGNKQWKTKQGILV